MLAHKKSRGKSRKKVRKKKKGKKRKKKSAVNSPHPRGSDKRPDEGVAEACETKKDSLHSLNRGVLKLTKQKFVACLRRTQRYSKKIRRAGGGKKKKRGESTRKKARTLSKETSEKERKSSLGRRAGNHKSIEKKETLRETLRNLPDAS